MPHHWGNTRGQLSPYPAYAWGNLINPGKTWLHDSKAVANYSQLVPCYLFNPLISTTSVAIFQDFPVSDFAIAKAMCLTPPL